MFNIAIKDNGPDLDIVITRVMLVLAAIAVTVYGGDEYHYACILSSVALLFTAIFIKLLVVRFSIKKLVLLGCAATVVFIATHSFAFAIILLIYGYLVKFLNKKPTIEVSDEGITLQKTFASPAYQWDEFSNIILKDGLLTLDFKNNKLIQVGIDENRTPVDENEFNDFCKVYLTRALLHN